MFDTFRLCYNIRSFQIGMNITFLYQVENGLARKSIHGLTVLTNESTV